MHKLTVSLPSFLNCSDQIALNQNREELFPHLLPVYENGVSFHHFKLWSYILDKLPFESGTSMLRHGVDTGEHHQHDQILGNISLMKCHQLAKTELRVTGTLRLAVPLPELPGAELSGERHTDAASAISVHHIQPLWCWNCERETD